MEPLGQIDLAGVVRADLALDLCSNYGECRPELESCARLDHHNLREHSGKHNRRQDLQEYLLDIPYLEDPLIHLVELRYPKPAIGLER